MLWRDFFCRDEDVDDRDPGYGVLSAFKALGYEFPIVCHSRCALCVSCGKPAYIKIFAEPGVFYASDGEPVADPSCLNGCSDCFESVDGYAAFQVAARCKPAGDFEVWFDATVIQESVDSFRFEDISEIDFSQAYVWGEIVESKPSSADVLFSFVDSVNEGLRLSFGSRKRDHAVELGEEMAWARSKRGNDAEYGVHFFIEPGKIYKFGFYPEPLAVRYVDAF